MEDEEKIKFGHASDMAGEYLDELGKTDLATLTRDEWLEFLHVVVKGYHSI